MEKKTYKDLAKDIGWSVGEIYHCVRFAQMYPILDDALKNFSDASEKLSLTLTFFGCATVAPPLGGFPFLNLA